MGHTVKDERGPAVILEVVTNTGKVLNHLNPGFLQVLSRCDTAALENLGRVNGASREDDLALGADGFNVATINGPELDGGGVLTLVDDEAGDLVLDQEVEVGSAVSNGGVVANAGVRPLDGL